MKRHFLLYGVVAALVATSAAGLASPANAGVRAAPSPWADLALAAPPDISLSNIQTRLQQFQTIASSNGGNRRSTTAGYTASVNYVFNTLVAAGYSVVTQTCASGCVSGAGPNVIADWPGGDPNQVLMFGAHLDGVTAGPGINDNASGSSALLEVATVLAAQNPTMVQHVRFAWWTDEEQGLNGSQFYANTLPSSERAKITAYYNFDMIGSTNGGYFINRITSAVGQTVKAYYDSIGVATEENTEGVGRSDDASFNAIGVQTSGIAAGASRVKTSAQVAKWGGSQSAFDPCYHQSCDTYPSNISTTVLNRAADAIAHVLWTRAVGTPAGDDFSISVSPTSGSTAPGGSVNSTVSTALTSGSAQTIALSASGLPGGASASFVPSSVSTGGSSGMTINTAGSTPAGTYPVTVTGTGTSATHSTTYTLTVTGAGPTTVYSDTFETATGWTVNPNGTDTATTGLFERGNPASTSSSGPKQLGTTVSGSNDLVTGRLGGSAGNHDIDNGTTSIRSPLIALPATGTLTISMSWYLAHGSNSSSADFFRVSIVHNGGTTQIFNQAGAGTDRDAAWGLGTWNISAYAGQSIRVLIQAADASTASLVEAAADNVTIVRT